MCILTDQPNLNNLKFNENYIKGIVTNKEKFIGIPLVVNKTKLENGFYSNLNHEFDKSSNLLKLTQSAHLLIFVKRLILKAP